MAVNQKTMSEVLSRYIQQGQQLDVQDRLLLQAWARAWDVMVDELAQVVRQISEPHISKVIRRRKVAEAMAIVNQGLRQALSTSQDAATATAQAMIDDAGRDVAAIVASQLPAGAVVAFESNHQLAEIVKRTTQQITARHWVLEQEATEAMKRALVRTVAEGTNPRVAARRMVQDVKGVFNGGLTRARVIARTEQIDAYRAAAKQAMDDNKNMLAGWMWVAKLSARTCRSCLSKHGTHHQLDEPGPLDHQQGRCVRVPITKTWEELGFKGIKEPPPVVGESGEDWLKRQPAETQEAILTKRGAELWRAGDWPSSQWSTLRRTEGWRDSYGAASPPEAESGGDIPKHP